MVYNHVHSKLEVEKRVPKSKSARETEKGRQRERKRERIAAIIEGVKIIHDNDAFVFWR